MHWNCIDSFKFCIGLIAPPFLINFLATKMDQKVKLGRSNIAQNHSSSLQEVISGHYLPKFKLTNSEIMLSTSRFKHLSKSQI